MDEVAKTQELLNSLIKNNSYEYIIDHSGMGLEVKDTLHRFKAGKISNLKGRS